MLDGYENAHEYQTAILIGSRITSNVQQRQCPFVPDDAECYGAVWTSTAQRPKKTEFVAGVEEFSLLVDHSFSVKEAASDAAADDIGGQSA